MPNFVGLYKVRFSKDEVVDFMRSFPCSGLRERSYWFEFDAHGDLVDTDVPEQDDGSGAHAMSQDARNWMNENSYCTTNNKGKAS